MPQYRSFELFRAIPGTQMTVGQGASIRMTGDAKIGQT
jgi:hypothetical protein